MVLREDPEEEFGWKPPQKRGAATFGLPRGKCKPQCPLYLKKRAREEKQKTEKTDEKIDKHCLLRLVRKPILDMSPPALMNHKPMDFIKDNALAVIHQQPEQAISKEQPRSTKKPDYGRVPEYLKASKKKLQEDKAAKEEEQRIRAQQALDAKMTIMPDKDKQTLLEHLKRHWGALNAAYQKLPLQLDTPSKKRSKEFLEAKLAQCEADIQLLQLRPQVAVLHSDECLHLPV